MLAQRFGLRPGRGRNRIRAVAAEAALAQAVAAPPSGALDAVEQSLLQALQAVRRAREDQQE
ncbi:GntR family transcriptional regulator [Bordetella pertussis]|nr:GntR family transcriptional regulator [Bordetella pertussis]